MPTLARFGSVTVRMYADDHHPPHFHVVGPEFQVLVRIADMAIIAGSARPAQIAEGMGWATANKTFLAEKWAELNERA